MLLANHSRRRRSSRDCCAPASHSCQSRRVPDGAGRTKASVPARPHFRARRCCGCVFGLRPATDRLDPSFGADSRTCRGRYFFMFNYGKCSELEECESLDPRQLCELMRLNNSRSASASCSRCCGGFWGGVALLSQRSAFWEVLTVWTVVGPLGLLEGTASSCSGASSLSVPVCERPRGGAARNPAPLPDRRTRCW